MSFLFPLFQQIYLSPFSNSHADEALHSKLLAFILHRVSNMSVITVYLLVILSFYICQEEKRHTLLLCAPRFSLCFLSWCRSLCLLIFRPIWLKTSQAHHPTGSLVSVGDEAILILAKSQLNWSYFPGWGIAAERGTLRPPDLHRQRRS